MTVFTAQPHAAMDKFPAFLASIRTEFPDDCEAIADEMIDAELGDFYWESRIAEQRIGVIEGYGDEADEVDEEVRIIGFFRGRYLVATCILNSERQLRWMLKHREFETLGGAEIAFLAPQ